MLGAGTFIKLRMRILIRIEIKYSIFPNKLRSMGRGKYLAKT
jgi:hypothetical protein